MTTNIRTTLKYKFVVFLMLISTSGCAYLNTSNKQPSSATFRPTKFSELEGWNEKQAVGLRKALLKSCPVYEKRSGAVSQQPVFGTYEQWHTICNILPNLTDDALSDFFREQFQPYQVSPERKGLFTGYFTPLLHGSRTRSQRYSVPLISVPDDLVRFNPKDFDLQPEQPDAPHKILTAKINKGWLLPYEDREGINRRFEKGDYDNHILYWVDDRIDRFFLQIQGSGVVRLDTGERKQVRISGRNGHPYFAIGRYLKRNGLLEKVSMQTIRQWLEDNPERVDEVLYTNKDFIFFNEITGPGPRGAQGTPLVPQHSAAVDDSVIPLGTPLWIHTTLTADNTPWSGALVAQDVGSAIKGQVRADIYFGAGDEAARRAGFQNAGGKLFILVPKADTPGS